MERAWNNGIHMLEVKTDSISTVNLISKVGNLDHQHASIIGRFKKLLEQNWTIAVRHIYREANHLAEC
ncbi:hypothetical protein LINPERPRIM_LOCUS15449 [Linum perenne]